MRYPDRRLASHPVELPLVVDRERARFSHLVRVLSALGVAASPGGTARSTTARRGCPTWRGMGFDVLYFPPIHPIGRVQPQGHEQHARRRAADDVGSPWAIGAARGRPQGDPSPSSARSTTFGAWSQRAREHGIEIALDIAFQCAPDHPYVKEHPEWFRRRPDGSVQYAENPPKKYQDIYPFDFESDDWRALWDELTSVIDVLGRRRACDLPRRQPAHQGLPRSGSGRSRASSAQHPDVIFLSEAFTRPKVMHRLAKLGFIAVATPTSPGATPSTS